MDATERDTKERGRGGPAACLALALALGSIGGAAAQVVTTSDPAADGYYPGARYRSLSNSNPSQSVFVGVRFDDPGNRSIGNFNWTVGSNAVTLIYDPATDVLTSEVVNGFGTHTTTFSGVAADIASQSADAFGAADLNVLRLLVMDRDANAEISFDDVTVNGVPVGSFAGGDFTTGARWVTEVCLGEGFTITGDLAIAGSPSNSQELNRVEIEAGVVESRGLNCPEPVDLVAALSPSVGAVAQGEALVFTMDVTNGGPFDAPQAAATLELAPGLEYLSDDGGCTADGQRLACDLGTLAAGASTQILVAARAGLAAAPGIASAVLRTATPAYDADPASDDTQAPVLIEGAPPVPEASLSVTLLDDADPVAPGDALTLTATVTNGGPDTATGTQLFLNLPALLAVDSIAGCDPGSSDALCLLGSVAGGASREVTITGTVDPLASGILSSSVVVLAEQPEADFSDNQALQETSVMVPPPPPPPEPLVDLAARTDGEAVAGTTYRIDFTIDAVDDVTGLVLDLELVTGQPVGDVTGCIEAGPAALPRCTVGDLGAGGTRTIVVELELPADGEGSVVNLIGQIEANEALSAGSTDRQVVLAAVEARADLAVSVTNLQDQAFAGGLADYEIVVVNNGPSDVSLASLDALLDDEHDPATAQWTCAAGPGASCAAGASGPIADLFSIPAGGSITYLQSTSVLEDAAGGSEMTYTAVTTLAPTASDPQPDNDSASHTHTVIGEEPVLEELLFRDGFEPGARSVVLAKALGEEAEAPVQVPFDPEPGLVDWLSMVDESGTGTVGAQLLALGDRHWVRAVRVGRHRRPVAASLWIRVVPGEGLGARRDGLVVFRELLRP